MRRIVRVAVLVMVIGCVVALLSASSGSSGGSFATGTRQASWFSIGQPWPWYESRMEQEVRPDGGRAFSGESGVIRNSPAWFVLAGAVLGLVVFRRLRPGTPAAALA
jgi:hypothetical protein